MSGEINRQSDTQDMAQVAASDRPKRQPLTVEERAQIKFLFRALAMFLGVMLTTLTVIVIIYAVF